MLDKKVFYYLAPHFFSESGHIFNYLSSCQQILEKKVDAFYAYLPISSQISSSSNNWKKWFHRKVWKDWVQLFRPSSTNQRIFFLEHYAGSEFCFFALAALLFGKKNDILWVFYRLDPTTQRKITAFSIRFLTRLLKIKFAHRLVPFTDNIFLAQYYGKWFKHKMHYFPVIACSFSEPDLKNKEQKQKLICLAPGVLREDKGIDEIAKLLQIEDSKSTLIEIRISDAMICPPIRNDVVVRLHSQTQTKEEYYNAFCQSDVVLLPYNPTVYRWRSSGCFVEAILAGKIPLVKEGSWLAHELKRFHLHELIVNWDNPLFFTDLLQCLKTPSLKEKIREIQKEYIQTQTEAAFAKKIQSILTS